MPADEFDEYTVIAVNDYYPNPETPCWAVDMMKPDGTPHRHVFPKDTLAWRAAEYGIDPADTEQLMDIVLHEPWAPHPDDALTAAEDPVLAAGMLAPAVASRGTVAAGDPVPTTLYTARTTAEAREAHLMRISYAKARVRVTGPQGKGGSSPLGKILDTAIDPQDVAARAAWVDANRRRLQGEQVPEEPRLPIDQTAVRRAIASDKEATRA